MRKLFQKLFTKPVIWAANKFSSSPDKKRVFRALSKLYRNINAKPGKKGIIIDFDASRQKFIILSDQHKGARNGADDFAQAEKNYLAALSYYYQNNFYYINLGDSEELWENTLPAVKKHNAATFEKEKMFLRQNRFTKIFGNHDLYWGNDPLASFELETIYGQKVTIYEGIILRTGFNEHALQIFCTHGHQGDKQSDGNWFSKWFVASVWQPLQAYLKINPNTPAYNTQLKTLHNTLMYEWSSSRKNTLLVTGHTHQPVFASLTLLERLYQQLEIARQQKDTAAVKEITSHITGRLVKGEEGMDFTKFTPGYFNSGCCCFSDGDITGIEIADGKIRLVKWEYEQGASERKILEEAGLPEIAGRLN
jgi:predicted phosphodiesterase